MEVLLPAPSLDMDSQLSTAMSSVALGMIKSIPADNTSHPNHSKPMPQTPGIDCNQAEACKTRKTARDIQRVLVERAPFTVLKEMHDFRQNEPRLVLLIEQAGTQKVLKIREDDDGLQEVTIMKSLHGKIPIPTIYEHGTIETFCYIFMEYIDNAKSLDVAQIKPCLYKDFARVHDVIREHTMDTTGFKLKDWYYFAFTGEESSYVNLNEFMNKRSKQFVHDEIDFGEYKLVLTHCDIQPRNVLVSSDGSSVAAIIDWEMAGYYPPFYEFYNCLRQFKDSGVNDGKLRDKWLEVFDTPCTQEIDLRERILWNHYRSKFFQLVVDDAKSEKKELVETKHLLSDERAWGVVSHAEVKCANIDYHTAYNISRWLASRLDLEILYYIIKKTKLHRKITLKVRRNGEVQFCKILFNAHHTGQEVKIISSLHGKVPVPEVAGWGNFGLHSYLFTRLVENAVPISQCYTLADSSLIEELKTYWETIRAHKIDDISTNMHHWHLVAAAGSAFQYTTTSDFINKRLLHSPQSCEGLPDHDVVLTHCNALMQNILVSHDFSRVVAIMDWEYAGYHPDYYESWSILHKTTDDYLMPGVEYDDWLDVFEMPACDEIEDLESHIVDIVNELGEPAVDTVRLKMQGR